MTSMQHNASLQANVELKDRAILHRPGNYHHLIKYITLVSFYILDKP